MPENLPRKEEQRGMRNIMVWSLAIGAALIITLMVVITFGTMGSGTSPTERAEDQNKGADAPTGTQPPAGTQKDEINGGTKLPEGQQ